MPEETETPEVPEHRAVDGFFSTEEAPFPHACETPSDCTGDTIPDAGNPCCNNPRSLRRHSRAYWQWIHAWHAAECEEFHCPPTPSPSMPNPCSVEGIGVNQC